MEEVKGLKPKAVVFDLDGTIIDSMEVFYQDLREICQRVGLSQVSKEKVLEIMRRGVSPWDFLLPIDFPNRGNVINQCQAIDKEIWAEIYRREAKLFPGCAEVMRRIKGAGIKIGVVSSGWEGEGEITQLLKEGGIYYLIDVMITKFDVSRMKPAPDPIKECLKKLCVLGEDAVYVGDSPLDITAGRKAQTFTIGVLTGVSDYNTLLQEKPDVIIDDVTKLTKMLNL